MISRHRGSADRSRVCVFMMLWPMVDLMGADGRGIMKLLAPALSLDFNRSPAVRAACVCTCCVSKDLNGLWFGCFDVLILRFS